jgi:aspartate/methionine/tyrosine aminotransferase
VEEFLPWIKDLVARLHGRADCFNLMGSGISEPAEILWRLAAEYRTDADALFRGPNEWGHVALARALADRYALAAEKEIQVTSGATAAYWLVCRALLTPGDRVLVEAPTYEPLRLAPTQLGAEVAPLPRLPESGYQLDLDELGRRMTPRTRLVVLTNLHNPSGAVLSDDTLRRAAGAATAVNPDVTILVDETFHDFILDEQPSCARLGPAFVAINTLTKVYGLGFLRCGWVVAEPEIVGRVRRHWMAVAGIGSRLTEALATLAVAHIHRFETHWRGVLVDNRPLLGQNLGPLVEEGLLRGNVTPEGCICFPEVVGCRDTEALTRQLAAESVYVVPGRFFEHPGHVRLGFGGDTERLADGLARFAAAVRRLAE